MKTTDVLTEGGAIVEWGQKVVHQKRLDDYNFLNV